MSPRRGGSPLGGGSRPGDNSPRRPGCTRAATLRPRGKPDRLRAVVIVEVAVATAVVIVAAAVSASRRLLVAGFAAHGMKDLWPAPHGIRQRHAMVAAVLRRVESVATAPIAPAITTGLPFSL